MLVLRRATTVTGLFPLLVTSVLIGSAVSIDNGVGLTPPMGWRHWKAFGADISQEIMENMMQEMITKYPVDGVPTSLADLGYLYAGLDDHWQNCTTTCANGTVIPSWLYNGGGYINCDNMTGAKTPAWYSDGTDGLTYGTPLIDHHRFPNMKAMVTKAHSLGLRAGWYMGNYQCSGANGHRGGPGEPPSWNMTQLVEGSVNALVGYGFDSVKLDSGFPVGSNLTLWAELLNESGRPVMIENCHQGGDGPGIVSDAGEDHNCTGLTSISDCPYNFWRTTSDPEPDWGTIMRELNSLRKVVNPNYDSGKRPGAPEYNSNPPRTRPGGFAYPGTMVVGDGGTIDVNGTLVHSLTKDENRVHFGGWCIVSSPLILAYNLSCQQRRELVWDIITNKEAIYVNQAWVGHPGSQVLAGIGNNSATEVWTKPLGDGRTAAFIVNTADEQKYENDWGKTTRAGMSMQPCNASRITQNWMLSPEIVPTMQNTTNFKSAAVDGCIEITGCNTGENAAVGTGYGCKPLPKNNCANTCDCNGAWSLHDTDGTILSVMDHQCLQTSVGSHIDVGTCVVGSSAQKFKFVVSTKTPGNYLIQQGDKCVDNNQATPPAPPTPPRPVGPSSVTINLSDLKLGIAGKLRVRDVWNKQDLPPVISTSTFATTIPVHGCVFVIFMPVDSKWPLPFELAPWMRSPAPPPPPSS